MVTLCWRLGGWDFEHKDGCRLEVKQSAAKQTWITSKSYSPRFDIAKRTGYWDKSLWLKSAEEIRFANIYVFTWHDINGDDCNHFDASQWQFFVIAEKMLPDTSKSIGLKPLSNLVNACNFAELANNVEELRLSFIQ